MEWLKPKWEMDGNEFRIWLNEWSWNKTECNEVLIDFTTCILTLACLYIIYANQQITLILNFYSIVVLLFLNFFSINDIYLLSFFIGLIYSGALVISFLFVLMIIDLNVFNLRNNVCLISFGFFMNQQCYNSFSFLMIHFSLSFLFNLRKIKQY